MMMPFVTLMTLAVGLAPGDAAADRPAGSWKRVFGDNEVVFRFQGDKMNCTLRTDFGGSLDLDADIGMTRTGTIFGIVTRIKSEGIDGAPQVGDLFSFHVTSGKGTLVIKDLKSPSGADASQLIEGEYKSGGK